jgi:hypothetical protein
MSNNYQNIMLVLIATFKYFKSNNGNKCKDIKNNKKTYKISLLTSMINKKNENEKIQIKRTPTKAKSNKERQV